MATWTTIESDPGVFTELVESFGCKDVQFEEIYTMDAGDLDSLGPVYAFIFLFKWRQGDQDKVAGELVASPPPGLFFAKQVITNACATQAILSALLNLDAQDVDIGPNLRQFKDFTKDFPPDLKGVAINNSDLIREAHNSFSRPEPFVGDDKAPTSSEDVYHFITYMNVNGVLYELDGLKDSPISHGACTADNWVSKAVPVIQQRISTYAQSEIHFNMMAIIRNRRQVAESKIAQLEQAKLTDPNQAPDLDQYIKAQQAIIEAEKSKFYSWRRENLHRKHNYVPFVLALVKLLAQKNELAPLIAAAKKT